jgi:ribonuclease P protein component
LAPAVAPDRRRERLPRAARVRHRTDYLAIQNRGRRVAGPHLLLFALAGEGPEGRPGRPGRLGRHGQIVGQGRIGITVSKKVGNAVVRNRVKRWIRECYRRRRPQFPARLDLVVVARPAAATASHAVVCRELTTLVRRFGSP